MGKPDSKSKAERKAPDVEHELPGANAGEQEKTEPRQQANSREDSPGSRPDLEKLRAERDSLADRLARQQAEFGRVSFWY